MMGRGLLQPRGDCPAAGLLATGTSFPKEEKDLMLQAFIITLREGVEASLIVGIVFAYLSKIGRLELKRTVFWALGSAVVGSIGVALVVTSSRGG
jgi:high-affinity Fe2+/Pb2+ permease